MELSPGAENKPQATGNGTEPELASAKFPERYAIRMKGEDGELVCNESPNMVVRIAQGKTIPGSPARKAPPGTIYLDGVAEGGPFLDVEKAVFNLDHHEGCVRSFTLATCEQAMVVVCKGLDLQKRDWIIYANDPDLDTVFAIWVLLNHKRLTDADPEIRRKVMPLLRLQGTIDTHGLEMRELCGFPPELQESIFATLERLRGNEAALRKDGKWQEIDFLKYTVEIAAAVSYPIAAEVLFRGVVHGTLAQRFHTQHDGGPWFLSWPVVISSIIYALWSSLPFLPFFSRGVGLTFAAALLFGMSCGIARERSESLLPCLILHESCLLMLALMFFYG